MVCLKEVLAGPCLAGLGKEGVTISLDLEYVRDNVGISQKKFFS